MSLSDLTPGRNNNLNALRLIAAVLVLFYHSFTHLQQDMPEFPFFYRDSIGIMGVDIFFFISGFLITQSFLRQPPINFLKARVLRIFPALLAVVFLTVFVLAPLETTSKFYFQSYATYHYLLNATLLDFNNFLIGLRPVPSGVNISLWTLQYEVLFYLAVLGIGILGVLKDRRIVLGMFLMCVVLTYFNFGRSYILTNNLTIYKIVWLFSYFGAGMTAYLYREYLTLNAKYFLFVLALLLIGAFSGGYADALFVFLLAYAVLFIGYYPKIKLNYLTRWGDFSYGIYLWSSLVLNGLIIAFGFKNPLLLFACALPITYGLGALSWHLLEKRALALKGVRLVLKRRIQA